MRLSAPHAAYLRQSRSGRLLEAGDIVLRYRIRVPRVLGLLTSVDGSCLTSWVECRARRRGSAAGRHGSDLARLVRLTFCPLMRVRGECGSKRGEKQTDAACEKADLLFHRSFLRSFLVIVAAECGDGEPSRRLVRVPSRKPLDAAMLRLFRSLQITFP